MKTIRLWFLLNHCRSACLFGVLGSLSLMPAGVAQSQPVGEAKESVSQRGFVFVDGEYLPPPYVVKEAESGVEINGRTILMEETAVPPSEARRPRTFRGGPGSFGGEWQRGRWGNGTLRYNGQTSNATERTEFEHAPYVAKQLSLNSVLIAEAGEEVSFLWHEKQIYEFLGNLLGIETNDLTLGNASQPSTTASQRVNSSNFSPSPSFVERARQVIAEIDGHAAEGLAAETGLQRLSMLAFPLTIAGMILSCFASGHLVSYPPRPIDPEADARAFLLSQRATVICLVLLIALSGLDLAWTLLASQAGQMIELNPLGSRMVDNPLTLVGFKVSVTLASCGILFAFRRRHSARLASWWLCMALTLLTFRWLVFNSMQAA